MLHLASFGCCFSLILCSLIVAFVKLDQANSLACMDACRVNGCVYVVVLLVK